MRHIHMEKISFPIPATIPQREMNPVSAHPIGMVKVVSARRVMMMAGVSLQLERTLGMG
jgi:hypothetical protein